MYSYLQTCNSPGQKHFYNLNCILKNYSCEQNKSKIDENVKYRKSTAKLITSKILQYKIDEEKDHFPISHHM